MNDFLTEISDIRDLSSDEMLALEFSTTKANYARF